MTLFMSTKNHLHSVLKGLEDDHRRLEKQVAELRKRPVQDQLAIQRLKKNKFVIQDKIKDVRDTLTPDIIA